MRALGLASLAIFLLTSATIGLRLLRLAGRTRGAPEFCAGAGLLCLALLAHPFSALGRLPGLVGTLPGDVLFATGMATTTVGIVLMYEFTRRTFRPGHPWAVALVVFVGVAAALETAGLMNATAGAQRLEDVLPRARPWTIAICLTLAGAFVWTALESLLYYGPLKKRAALGLTDPVVANRVWLWSASGVTISVLLVEIAELAGRGAMVLQDPLALMVTALCGVASSSFWYLAFLPPSAYTRWVRRRAARRTAS